MAARRRSWFARPGTAAMLGTLLLAASWACFYDAYNRRGRQTPAALRPVLPF